jgi:hypothetical protein
LKLYVPLISIDSPEIAVYQYWRAAMLRRLVLLLPMFAAALAPARDKAETWTEVRSPHFVVVTNASEKQGPRVADTFVWIRSVFQVTFPKLQSHHCAGHQR